MARSNDDTVVQLLTEIRDTGAASAIVLREILEELCRPRRTAEKINAEGVATVLRNEAARLAVEQRHAEERRLMPSLRIGGAIGIPTIRTELPVLDSDVPKAP